MIEGDVEELIGRGRQGRGQNILPNNEVYEYKKLKST